MNTIIDTATIAQDEALSSAVLSLSTADTGTLELSWAGFGPDWLAYRQPVTLIHKGAVVFHGQLTEAARSNDGSKSTTATISNMMYLLDRLSAADQIYELIDDNDDSDYSFGTGQFGTGTVASIFSSTTLSAEGWCVNDDGSLNTTGVVLVQCSSGMASRVSWAFSNSYVTLKSRLATLRDNNPDMQFVFDYTAGTITATSLRECPSHTLDTADQQIISATDISPQWDATVNGVIIAYVNSANTDLNALYKYPSTLSLNSEGIKVFSVSSAISCDWKTAVQQYYAAANELQYGGTITLVADKMTVAPIGYKLNITGEGAHDDWASMEAICTGVEWDLLTGEMECSLGHSCSDPTLSDAVTGASSSDEDADGGGGDWQPEDDTDFTDATDSTDDWDDYTGGVTSYTFDPTYFTVSGTSVTLNTTALDAIVDEAVSEIDVEVTVSGLADYTEYGQLTVNTSGTADEGLNTTVSY